MDLTEKRISGSVVYDGHFLKVEKDLIELPDGKRTHREFIRHPGAVVVLPLLEDGRVLLERQWRYPNGQVFIEFPAGKIDPGEDHLACAQRELREETGYTATDWQFVCTIHNAIAYSDEHLELFLARGLSPGEAKLDDGEFLECFTVTMPELLELVRTGKITDVKTIIGTFWLEKIVAGSWRPA
ncbi:MAG TPA: NUDIX hydrolase [Telluria sp.]|nr:NUDIX hydrolase [Telluria sp.]